MTSMHDRPPAAHTIRWGDGIETIDTEYAEQHGTATAVPVDEPTTDQLASLDRVRGSDRPTAEVTDAGNALLDELEAHWQSVRATLRDSTRPASEHRTAIQGTVAVAQRVLDRLRLLLDEGGHISADDLARVTAWRDDVVEFTDLVKRRRSPTTTSA